MKQKSESNSGVAAPEGKVQQAMHNTAEEKVIKRLDALIQETIEQAEPGVNASLVATRVMKRLDPNKSSPPAMHDVARTWIKQRAARIIEQKFAPPDNSEEEIARLEAWWKKPGHPGRGPNA